MTNGLVPLPLAKLRDRATPPNQPLYLRQATPSASIPQGSVFSLTNGKYLRARLLASGWGGMPLGRCVQSRRLLGVRRPSARYARRGPDGESA